MNSIKVCNNAFTLSGKGFPCQNDPNDFSCAWCTKTGFQWGLMIYFWKMKICIKFFLIRCFPDKNNGPDSKEGSRCAAQKNQKYCKSVQGDCRHISGACPPERWALPCLSLVHTAVLNWPIRDKNMWCHQLLLGSFRCEFQSKINKYMKYYECECADGYTGDYSAVVTTVSLHLVKISISGNGLQCFDANGTMAISGDAYVELEMTLKSEVEWDDDI